MQLDESDLARLRDEARQAAGRAYCPYSGFAVGAAVMTDDGSVFSGCNVENASYGLTICAERNAVFQAVAAGRRRILAVAVYTPTSVPTPPCGACRQVILEFGGEAEVISFADAGEPVRARIRDLLPKAFGPVNAEQ